MAVLIIAGPTLQEDFRLLRTDVVARAHNVNSASDWSAVLFGICNGELTATEIAECLTAGGPLDRNDRVPAEQASRFVRVLSAIDPGDKDGTEFAFKNKTGGPIISEPVRWTFSDPEAWNWFIFNFTGSALITGALFDLYATNYGVWVT